MGPEKISGADFEQAVKDAAARLEKAGVLTLDTYGVTLSVQNGVTMGISSKPDFEGVFATGRQFIFETKVCGDASFSLTKDKLKPRQVAHLLRRSRFNVPTFLLLHWTARQLKKSYDPAVTVAIPVNDLDPRWQRYVDAYAEARKLGLDKPLESQGSISREEAKAIGLEVPWEVPKGCRKAVPCLLAFLAPGQV